MVDIEPSGRSGLTAAERQALIWAVEPWQEFSAAWYVDRYLAPVVAALLEARSHGVAAEPTA